ncbi:hypothetical protein AAVH_16854 [Aphelenchoides avenae]|nr:hypothetical protein AAVH_16854 [Aphelenchus avenae]
MHHHYPLAYLGASVCEDRNHAFFDDDHNNADRCGQQRQQPVGVGSRTDAQRQRLGDARAQATPLLHRDALERTPLQPRPVSLLMQTPLATKFIISGDPRVAARADDAEDGAKVRRTRRHSRLLITVQNVLFESGQRVDRLRFSGVQLTQTVTPRPPCTIQESCVSDDSSLNVSLPSSNDDALHGERSSAIETPSKGLRQQPDDNIYSSDFHGSFRVTSTPVKGPARKLTCFTTNSSLSSLCGGSDRWLLDMLPPLPPYSPLKSQPSHRGVSQKTPSKSTVDSLPSASASAGPRIRLTPARKSPKWDIGVLVEESVVEPLDAGLVRGAVDFEYNAFENSQEPDCILSQQEYDGVPDGVYAQPCLVATMHPAQHVANVNVEHVNALIDWSVQLRRRRRSLLEGLDAVRMQLAARAPPVTIPPPPVAPRFNDFQPGTPRLPQNARRGTPNAEPEPQVQRGMAQEPVKPLNAYFLSNRGIKPRERSELATTPSCASTRATRRRRPRCPPTPATTLYDEAALPLDDPYSRTPLPLAL